MGCCGNKTEDEGLEMNSNAETGVKGKYGEKQKYDPSFNGPIKNRKCTDVICCIVFLLYVAGMLVVGGISYYMGDPNQLLNPTDSQGNVCGKTAKVKDKPYLLYFDLTECISTDISPSKILSSVTNCPTYQICVKTCPSTNQAALTASASELYCKYDADTSSWSSKSYLEKKDYIFTKKACAPYSLQSTSILSRCIPTIVGTTLSKFLSNNQQNITNGNRNITQKNCGEW